MSKIIFALILSVFMASFAFADGIETMTLIDVQSDSETSLLLNASDALKSEYYPSGRMPSQILAFFVKFGETEILFDTGLQDEAVVSKLAENGVAPKSVKKIFITHLHHDHFGGLLDSSGKAAFPNATVYVSKPEYTYWVKELRNQSVIAALDLYNVKTFVFGDEIVPGVRAIDTMGHTPGHTSYLIDFEGEKLMIAGDVIHFQGIQLPNPDVAVRYDIDSEKAIQSRKFLLDYVSSKNIPIAGMHMIPPGIVNVQKTETGYEVK